MKKFQKKLDFGNSEFSLYFPQIILETSTSGVNNLVSGADTGVSGAPWLHGLYPPLQTYNYRYTLKQLQTWCAALKSYAF